MSRYNRDNTKASARVTRGDWEIESVHGSQKTAAQAAFAYARYDRKTGLVRPRRVQRKSSGWAVLVRK